MKITELLYPNYGQTFDVVDILVDEQSSFQHIQVVSTTSHGIVMLLDGVVQITEKDEFFYSEMMVHPAAMSLPERPKKILIIGGGDGAVAEEALKHGAEVIQAEIDPKVIEHCKTHFASVSGSIWNNPKFTLHVGDGFEFLKNSADETFDLIIADRPDPIGPAQVLFAEEFYSMCCSKLTKHGILVCQNGVPFYQLEELVETNKIQKAVFNHSGFMFVPVPTYIGGAMAISWASKTTDMKSVTLKELALRVFTQFFIGPTDYYTIHIHTAAFAIPSYIAKKLKLC
jgi:spermidine synthase